MKRLRRIMLYTAGIAALAFMLLQAAALLLHWGIGLEHATRHQVAGVDETTQRGVWFDGGLCGFLRHDQLDSRDARVWGDLDYDTWGKLDARPSFGVTSPSPPIFVNSDKTLLHTGYRHSVAYAGHSRSEYHLILIGPLVVFLACVVVVAIAARERIISVRTARRGREGQCLQCGYDLRAGHERCPECGAPTIAHP